MGSPSNSSRYVKDLVNEKQSKFTLNAAICRLYISVALLTAECSLTTDSGGHGKVFALIQQLPAKMKRI